MHVLIGGGSGFIGQNLIAFLKRHSYDISIISRFAGENKITWQDLKEGKVKPKCDILINLAGENINQKNKKWNLQYKKDIRDSRILTNQLLVDLMKRGKFFFQFDYN